MNVKKNFNNPESILDVLSDKKNNYLLFFIICTSTLLAINFFILDVSTVIFGGNYITQFLPIQNEAVLNFRNEKFPFFSFNINFGFDILAESQQSLGHPFKIILLFLNFDGWLINNLFIYSHFIILTTGSFYYFKKISNTNIASFLSISILISVGYINNIAHPFSISALSYLPWILLIIDKISESNNKSFFFYLTILIWLSILVGHFQTQWNILFITLIYIFFSGNKKNKFVIFLCSNFFAFILASYQLLPTLVLMLDSARASVGGFNKFEGSASILTFLNYINPGINWFLASKLPNFVSQFSYYNVVEHVHYVGILPISAIIASFISKENLLKKINQNILITLIVLIFKSMGIYFFINILLNYLPIFGQFRIPARNLFLVDFFLIAIFAQIYMYCDLKIISKIIDKILILQLVLVLFSLSLYYFKDQTLININLIDIFFLSFAATIAVTYKFIIKFIYKFNLSINIGRYVLIMFMCFEVFIASYLSPKYFFNISPTKYQNTQKAYDQKCKDHNSDRNVIVEKMKNWDIPSMIFSKNSYGSYLGKNVHKENVQANGNNCYLNYWFSNSSIVQKNISNLEKKLRELNPYDLNLILSELSYNIIEIDSTVQSNQLKKNGKTSTSLKANIDIIEAITDKRTGLNFHKISQPLFKILSNLKVSNILISRSFKTISLNERYYLPISTTDTYVIKNDDGKIIDYGYDQTFVSVNKAGTYSVTHIPVTFLVGLLMSFFSGLILIILFVCWSKLNILISSIKNKLYFYDLNFSFHFKTDVEKINKLLNNFLKIILIIYTLQIFLFYFIFQIFFFSQLIFYLLFLFFLHLLSYKKEDENSELKLISIFLTINILIGQFGFNIFNALPKILITIKSLF